MALAQKGADVIRLNPIQGGLGAHRWPVTDRKSIHSDKETDFLNREALPRIA
jgi:hypothetical protein